MAWSKKLAGSVFVAVVLMLMAAGGITNDAAALPLPEELPANTVAVVSHVPLDLGTITKRELHHALVLNAAMAGRDPVPLPGEDGYDKIKDRALGELLDAVWISGQAAEMHITTSPREVAFELAQIKEFNFKSEAEWHRFIRESHFTRHDLNERVELQILSTRIQEKIVGRVRSKSGEQRAFKQFVEAYLKRWKARTICAPEYATMKIERCSNAA